MKIATIIGARPQFIKAAAFSRCIAGVYHEILIHTGQHYDKNMSDIFFSELGLQKPKYNLGIHENSHGAMTGEMIKAIERVLVEEKPNIVLVYGDTNSTIAGALAAVKLHIPIAHVEAGARVGGLSNPENINRILTDHISSMLFTVSEIEMKNLLREGLGDRGFIVGNIMYDSYVYAKKQIQQKGDAFCLKLLEGGDVEVPLRFVYLTCHREENTRDDEALREIFQALNQLDVPTVYPVHPRNQKRAIRIRDKDGFHNIILAEPVGYFESVQLMELCERVVTDSGGLQCEAFYAEKPCITVLGFAAWPQTMVGNRNQLSPPRAKEILRRIEKKQVIDKDYRPFGDGNTSKRIVDILAKEYETHCN